MNTTKLRQDFHKVLEQTIVPSSMFPFEKAKQYESWPAYSNDAVPKQLFRYRSYSTLSIEAFYYDQMWFSIASKMNDGFDTRFSYDKQQFINAINAEFSDDSLYQFFKKIFSSESPQKTFFQSYITQNDISNPSAFSNNQMIKALKTIRNSVMSSTTNIIDYLMNSLQNIIKIACLSEKITSPDMWGHYARSEEGFALQYDCSNIYVPTDNPNDQFPKQCNIYPVIYQQNRYNLPIPYLLYLFKQRLFATIFQAPNYSQYSQLINSILSSINPCPDESMITKIALYKSSEWKVEKEWRILCTSADLHFMNAEYGYIIKKPTAIYLGRRMSSNSRNLLIDIAKDKNLPIYEMRINDASPSYKLKPIKVN